MVPHIQEYKLLRILLLTAGQLGEKNKKTKKTNTPKNSSSSNTLICQFFKYSEKTSMLAVGGMREKEVYGEFNQNG